MRPQSRLAGSQNCGAIFQHLKLDMTLGAYMLFFHHPVNEIKDELTLGRAGMGDAVAVQV